MVLTHSSQEVARSLWYVAPGRAEIRAERLTARSAGDLRIRALHSGISRGTEALVQAGRVPTSEYERMRGPAMQGQFPFPVKYGYAVVGRIEAGPAESIGRTVFALHPHQDVFDAAPDAVIPVPDDVAPPRAVLAANMETALNAVWDAGAGPADRIAIVGVGVVGGLVGYLCSRLPGADVTLIDTNPARENLARAFGIKFAAPDNMPRDCDLVFHASGSAAGLASAVEAAGNEATIVELSWYGAGATPLTLGGAFHSRRLKLIASQVGQVSPSRRPRWSHRKRLAAGLALLADPALDGLLAPPVAFGELPARLPDILAPQSGVLCQLVNY